jgi:DNA helicase HerA-like ATPase
MSEQRPTPTAAPTAPPPAAEPTPARDEAFAGEMASGYAVEGPVIVLGSPLKAGAVYPEVRVQAALSILNRHGLVAGATGTGKTKTLQVMAGQLSDAGVPVFVADVKGDLTGLAAPGDAADERIAERARSLGWEFRPKGHPVEFLSLSGALGAPVRATVHSFGPLLLAKVLDLNKTQTAVLSLAFEYCDDEKLPLLDLADLRTTLRFLASEEGKPVLDEYGGVSPASVAVIQRSILTLEQAGGDAFFGEPEFAVPDILRTTPEGLGVITVLELSDVMDKPRLFSTFMLWLLAELYETMPEEGDLPKPKLCFFFDEAHLLFHDASEALLEQVERTARLIRSKGIGVYFVTHTPTDVPSSVLAQLSNRVQHAIRAFTPNDADDLRKAARTLPITTHYDVEETMTSLGIGEAFVTVLSPEGVPTPLAATRIVPPDSYMGALEPAAFAQALAAGQLGPKYGQAVDRESAHEVISRRIETARAAAGQAAFERQTGSPWVATPTTATGMNTMTRAQQQAELRRQRNEILRQERAEKKAREQAARQDREQVRQQRRAERERDRTVQAVVRGVFGVLRRL